MERKVSRCGSCSMHDSVHGLSVVIGCLSTSLRRHTNMIMRRYLPPDRELLAGIWAIGSIGVTTGVGLLVISGRLTAHVGSHTDIILGPCFPPPKALFADICRTALSRDLLAVGPGRAGRRCEEMLHASLDTERIGGIGIDLGEATAPLGAIHLELLSRGARSRPLDVEGIVAVSVRPRHVNSMSLLAQIGQAGPINRTVAVHRFRLSCRCRGEDAQQHQDKDCDDERQSHAVQQPGESRESHCVSHGLFLPWSPT